MFSHVDVKYCFSIEVLYTSLSQNIFFSAMGVVAQNWYLFYFHLYQPKLGLYSFCILILVHLWFNVV